MGVEHFGQSLISSSLLSRWNASCPPELISLYSAHVYVPCTALQYVHSASKQFAHVNPTILDSEELAGRYTKLQSGVGQYLNFSGLRWMNSSNDAPRTASNTKDERCVFSSRRGKCVGQVPSSPWQSMRKVSLLADGPDLQVASKHS